MDTVQIMNLTTKCLLLVLILSLPPIIVASAVGILVSFLQAITQIQEQTLSFAIKLLAVIATIFLTASYMGAEAYNYTIMVFNMVVHS